VPPPLAHGCGSSTETTRWPRDERKREALAEQVARHPEDVGRTVEDFNWIARVMVRPAV